MLKIFSTSAIAAAAMLAAPAQASNAVALNSDVMVERTSTDANGRTVVSLEEPARVVPGDRLVFVIRYRNNGAQPASDFVITNPMPEAVAYQASDDGNARVSVDGGRSWGILAELSVTNADGTVRAARPEDVTHVRWAFAQPIQSGQAGRLMYRGVVR